MEADAKTPFVIGQGAQVGILLPPPCASNEAIKATTGTRDPDSQDDAQASTSQATPGACYLFESIHGEEEVIFRGSYLPGHAWEVCASVPHVENVPYAAKRVRGIKNGGSTLISPPLQIRLERLI